MSRWIAGCCVILCAAYGAVTLGAPAEVAVGLRTVAITKPILDAELAAQAWTEYLVATEWMPPKAARYVVLPRDMEGKCDKLRMRYEASHGVVTITQTRCIFAIEIDPISNKPGEKLAVADIQRLAQSLFKNGESVKLASSNALATEGRALPATASAPWTREFSWWHSDGRIGFCLLKDDGKPSALDKGMDLETNAVWFSVELPKAPHGKE